mmetsp:Transcript_7938/g.19977  ORF Transcript_7938/g.19977 Transcript_7938/m.19977 type:complete len:205 (+) Transcript_7938:124-738(+)
MHVCKYLNSFVSPTSTDICVTVMRRTSLQSMLMMPFSASLPVLYMEKYGTDSHTCESGPMATRRTLVRTIVALEMHKGCAPETATYSTGHSTNRTSPGKYFAGGSSSACGLVSACNSTGGGTVGGSCRTNSGRFEMRKINSSLSGRSVSAVTPGVHAGVMPIIDRGPHVHRRMDLASKFTNSAIANVGSRLTSPAEMPTFLANP